MELVLVLVSSMLCGHVYNVVYDWLVRVRCKSASCYAS